MKKTYSIYAILIITVLFSYGCGKEVVQDDSSTQNTEPSIEAPVTAGAEIKTKFGSKEDIPTEINDESVENTNPAPNESNVGEPVSMTKVFTISAKKWDFTPGEIVVNKGDTVRLEITSVDVKHGIGIPDFNISKELNPGEKTIIEFTADKTGTFSFFCNVMCGSGHRDMKGTLIVK